MESPHHLVVATRVLGAKVLNVGGENLGKIEDLMIDKVSGKTLYALMAFDGVFGIGTRYYPVPWAVLDYNRAAHSFVVSLTPAQIREAHHIDEKEVEDEINWREMVHTFYGASPYWAVSLG